MKIQHAYQGFFIAMLLMKVFLSEKTVLGWNNSEYIFYLHRNAATYPKKVHTNLILNHHVFLSPSRRREAPCEGTNSPRLFIHPWKRKN
jgi:hypothetical protein